MRVRHIAPRVYVYYNFIMYTVVAHTHEFGGGRDNASYFFPPDKQEKYYYSAAADRTPIPMYIMYNIIY